MIYAIYKKLLDSKIYIIIKRILNDTSENLYVKTHFYNYNTGRINEIEKKNLVYQLPAELKRDYINYYRSFGFKYVNTKNVENIYALTGEYDRRFLSDELFNLYIDPIFPQIRDFWQNKAYQKDIIKEDIYPNTIIRKVNGYYIDNNENIISEEDVLFRISKVDRIVIKPTLFTGGGYKVRFFNGNEVNSETLASYGKDFIVQEKLVQSELMESFNASSVNTIKMASFLHNGQVYISGAFLRVGSENSEFDNVTNQIDGYRVGVNSDGSLNAFGYDGRMNKIFTRRDGTKFQDIVLPHYNECVEIAKKVHQHLLYFPFVSWDFAQGRDGKPLLIEYNLKYHELYNYQIWLKPVLGDFTEEILKEAFERSKLSKSIFAK